MIDRKKIVYLGLGTNVGSRLDNLEECIQKLGQIDGLTIQMFSSIYESEPVGLIEQEDFLNMVVQVVYEDTPHKLLQKIKLVEEEMGRGDHLRWGPRIIDIDILYFGSLILAEKGLTIPHAEIQNRKFVLAPLKNLAKGFICPATRKSVSQLLDNCKDHSRIKEVNYFLESGMVN